MMLKDKSVAYKAWLAFLPFALLSLIFAGLTDIAVQQNYRMSANDPQIQIAEDVAAAVSQGQVTVDEMAQTPPTQDMSSTLSTFLLLYSATGTPIGGSATLNGKIPSLPNGVEDYTKLHNEDRITWQPAPEVRVAAVIEKLPGNPGGYALAGRSLREIEVREQNLSYLCLAALLGAWALSYILLFAVLKFLAPAEQTASGADTNTEADNKKDAEKPVVEHKA